MLQRRKPAPAKGRDRSDEFASFELPKPRARMASGLDATRPAAVPATLQKVPGRTKQSIHDSARDEECLIRLPGCPNDRAMTIWSHNRHQRAGKGGALKAISLNGAYGCTHCDAIYDGQKPRPAGWTEDMVELAWYHAHAESLVRLKQKGLA